MPADPGLNLEFVDEALSLVRDAEEKGIRLRILGSIAYRLQCPQNLHLFQDTKRVLTDVDFGAEKKQNRAIREFFMARSYVPDEGIYVASEGARHAYLHRQTGLNVDVFADELYSVIGFRSKAGSISTARQSARPTCSWRRCRSSRST
jgi:hypothetical protein